MNILYRDRHIAVCEKPRGVLSEGEAPNAMPALLAQNLNVPCVYPVHRLDRETEGLMVYALTKEAAAKLSATIASHEMTKEYEALVHGVPDPCEGRMEDLLFFDRNRGRSYVVDRMRRGVKDAALSYWVLATENGISRVRIRLHTGRTHQIRAQFASRKMPLLGDRRYGAPDMGKPLGLRACYLAFPHPATGEFLCFGERDDK